MASTKGTCTGTSSSKYNYYIDYNLTTPPGGGSSQDVANNRSYVTVKTTLQRNDGINDSAFVLDSTNRVIINVAGGGNEVDLYRAIDTRNRVLVTLGSWSGWLSHGTDGTLTVSLSGSFTMGLSTLTGGSVSTSWTLPSIPRASTATLNPAIPTMGQEMAIAITRASSTFTHTVTYAFGNDSGTIVTKTGLVSVPWTPPMSLAYNIPNSINGVGSITVYTYNSSGVLIGSNKYRLELVLAANVIPTVASLTFTRIDGDVPSAWGLYVRNKSKVIATVNGAAGVYGSTITSYSITGGGYSSNTSTLTTGFLGTINTNTFTATITDSRGRKVYISNAIEVIDWDVPKITNLLVERCDSSGVYQNDGMYFRVNCSYTFSSVSSKNSASAKAEYEINGSGTPIQTNIALSNGVSLIVGPISTDYSYKITVIVNDQLSSISVPKLISTAAVILDFKANGLGMAVGKVSELDNVLDVAWDIRMKGKFLQSVPIGTSLEWNSDTPPTGFVHEAGQVFNRATYSELFAVIGTRFGEGDGYSTFRLPNSRDSFAWTTGTASAVDNIIRGTEQVTLTTDQMPNHRHRQGSNTNKTVGNASWDATTCTTQSEPNNNGIFSYAAGGGQPHTNMPPYVMKFKIIRVF